MRADARNGETIEPANTAKTDRVVDARPARFNLKTLFLFTTACSIFFAMMAAWGFLGAFCTTMFGLLILATMIGSRPGLSPNQVF